MDVEVPVLAGAIALIVGLIALLARKPRETPTIVDTAPRSAADVLRDIGLRANGKVIFMQPTGNVVSGSKEFHVTVEVVPEVGRPYRVNLVSVVAPSQEHKVRIGYPVPIRIDPKKRDEVVIDLATA